MNNRSGRVIGTSLLWVALLTGMIGCGPKRQSGGPAVPTAVGARKNSSPVGPSSSSKAQEAARGFSDPFLLDSETGQNVSGGISKSVFLQIGLDLAPDGVFKMVASLFSAGFKQYSYHRGHWSIGHGGRFELSELRIDGAGFEALNAVSGMLRQDENGLTGIQLQFEGAHLVIGGDSMRELRLPAATRIFVRFNAGFPDLN